MRKATPVARKPRKKPALPQLDRYEIRARAQTMLLVNPKLTMREIAMALGQPYVLVRDVLDPVPEGEVRGDRGLSQYRWPGYTDEGRCSSCGCALGAEDHELGCAQRKRRTG